MPMNGGELWEMAGGRGPMRAGGRVGGPQAGGAGFVVPPPGRPGSGAAQQPGDGSLERLAQELRRAESQLFSAMNMIPKNEEQAYAKEQQVSALQTKVAYLQDRLREMRERVDSFNEQHVMSPQGSQGQMGTQSTAGPGGGTYDPFGRARRSAQRGRQQWPGPP